MTTPFLDHLDTAIKDMNNLKEASKDRNLKEKLSDEDRKKFLSIFLSKAKQQILMMELYLK
jgi:hypothetical protein